MKKNVKALQNECPQIIVGTPIRIVDLIHKGALKINKIQILVLDGCDRMIADSSDFFFQISPICRYIQYLSLFWALLKMGHLSVFLGVPGQFILDTDYYTVN